VPIAVLVLVIFVLLCPIIHLVEKTAKTRLESYALQFTTFHIHIAFFALPHLVVIFFV
jgi:hypothetical protein